MRTLSLTIAAAATLFAGSVAPLAAAQAEPAARLIVGTDNAADLPTATPVQFFWGGRNYCWYDGGWHGPGWYWCGYAWRRGFGWGGPVGWHGWHGGGGWRGGHGWHGGHGGGWHGGHGGGHGGGGDHHH